MYTCKCNLAPMLYSGRKIKKLKENCNTPSIDDTWQIPGTLNGPLLLDRIKWGRGGGHYFIYIRGPDLLGT